jgi:hypothetical protein
VAAATLASRPSSLASSLYLRDAERLRRYRLYLDFYEGRHFARPRNGRSNLVLNYARVVVDKGVAYLLGRGLNFAVEPDPNGGVRRTEAPLYSGNGGVRRTEAPLYSGAAPISAEAACRAEAVLYATYWDNDLDAVDLQVAQNAGTLGDGIYKVFFDPLARRIRVVNVDPFCFFARWAPDDPGTLLQVEVAYTLGADELPEGARSQEKESPPGSWLPHYRGAPDPHAAPGSSVDVTERWTADELTLIVGERVARRGPNPYGFIPFVHVPNMQPPNQFWGVSDLADVIPINRELNERISDQADTIRYHANPPVIFRGVTDHTDLAVGPGTVWDIPVDADVKLLEWQGQAPAVQAHIEQVFRALYEVSETPRTAFGDSGRLLSGVALETELRPIIQRTLRRRAFWNRALRQRNRMILQLAEQHGLDGARPGMFAPYRSRVVWPPMVPQDDAQDVRNNIALVAAGLRSHRTAMDLLGAETPEEEIRRVLEDRATLGESFNVPRSRFNEDPTPTLNGERGTLNASEGGSS